MAAIQRQIQISKAIANDDTRVLVINRKGAHAPATIAKENILVSGSFEGIDYAYASGTPKAPLNFIGRNLLKLVGFFGEFGIILYQRLFGNVICFMVSTSSLNRLIYFWCISRLLRVRLVCDYVEYMSSIDNRSMQTATPKKTFDTTFHKYTDSVIIISSFLEQHVKTLAPKLPYIIVPPIIDFEKFLKNDFSPLEPDYFLYCGSIAYRDVIEFIIEAYRQVNGHSHGVALNLIVNGSEKELTALRLSILADKSIKIISSLTYDRLIGYYKNARALLIPLQDNLQDRARFPFKISEYTAAARPIVTSDSGAVVDYFQDGVNALLAKTGDVNDFADKLRYILNHPEKAEQIGIQGHAIGQKHFNYKRYTPSIINFLSREVTAEA